MATLTYEGITQSILAYFGSTPYWNNFVNTASYSELVELYKKIPGVALTKSIDGTILGIDYPQALVSAPSVIDDAINTVDSNFPIDSYQSGGFTGNIPSYVYDNGSGLPISSSGVRNASGATVAAIADKLSLGVIGVSIGAKLGKIIDQTLYDLNPAWWDENLPGINPDTWVSIASENELGEFFIRSLFGIDDAGVTTPYIDERVLAYYYQMLRDMGVYSGGSSIIFPTPSPQDTFTNADILKGSVSSVCTALGWPLTSVTALINRIGDVDVIAYHMSDGTLAVFKSNIRSAGPYTISQINGNTCTFSPSINFNPSNVISYYPDGAGGILNGSIGLGYIVTCQIGLGGTSSNIILGSISQSPGVEGITDMDDATQYPPTNITGTTTDEVLRQLKQQYPQLFDGSVTSSVLQPDGTTKTITYVPVPYPTNTPTDETQPITPEDTTQNPIINPNSDTLPKIVEGTESGNNTPPTDPPNTGTGDGPISVLPAGQASSLWAVYNPSQAQLNSFGSWLWSSDFVDQLKRLFNDPMQAIIGVHKVFATPPTGGSQTIKCGYLDSGVQSAVVTSQYVEIDCGTVKLNEHFGNVFDYAPHTRISAYLPFIGVVPLDISDVMRASINISYGVDVITGACLAKIKVIRDNAGGVIYSFGGSCAVHYPISSGSYSGIISAGLSATTGILGAALTGNIMSAVAGVAGAVRTAHTDVQKSGGFTGASGACGPKKPYLIISRPQTMLANDFASIDGYPANKTTTISSCSGYIKCKEVHLISGVAYNNELSEIETLLKTGILI